MFIHVFLFFSSSKIAVLLSLRGSFVRESIVYIHVFTNFFIILLQVHLRRYDMGPYQAREIPEDELAILSS